MVLLLRPGTAAEDGRERGAFVAVVVDVFVLARPAAAADEDEDRLLLVGLLSPLLDDDDADDDECRWLRLVVVVAGVGVACVFSSIVGRASIRGVEISRLLIAMPSLAGPATLNNSGDDELTVNIDTIDSKASNNPVRAMCEQLE